MKKVVFALFVLSVSGFGGIKFYLPRFVDARIHEKLNNAMADIQKQNNQLAEIVRNLEDQQKKWMSDSSKNDRILTFEIDFDRWNCWCNLRNKLRHGSECSEELAKFRQIFSDCADLLKMVDSVAVVRNGETKSNLLINNLLKFARIRGVDKNELDRISGYVLLLSIRKV